MKVLPEQDMQAVFQGRNSECMGDVQTVTSPVLCPTMQAYPDVPLIEATVLLTGPKPAITSWTAVSIPCCMLTSIVYCWALAAEKPSTHALLQCAPEAGLTEVASSFVGTDGALHLRQMIGFATRVFVRSAPHASACPLRPTCVVRQIEGKEPLLTPEGLPAGRGDCEGGLRDRCNAARRLWHHGPLPGCVRPLVRYLNPNMAARWHIAGLGSFHTCTTTCHSGHLSRGVSSEEFSKRLYGLLARACHV